MRWAHIKLREKMTYDSKIIINEILLYSLQTKDVWNNYQENY